MSLLSETLVSHVRGIRPHSRIARRIASRIHTVRRSGSIVRLQPKPIDRSQLAREMLYSATSMFVFALVSIVIFLLSGKSHRFFYAHIEDNGWPYFFLSILIMMDGQAIHRT